MASVEPTVISLTFGERQRHPLKNAVGVPMLLRNAFDDISELVLGERPQCLR